MAERRDFHAGRHAGVLVPLFSIPSRSSWGVGEIADLARFAGWLRQAGLDFVQLLPVNEMQEGQNSPYSALSAMAIDPVFIALGEVPEFREAGGEAALTAGDRQRIDQVRAAAFVDFRTVRALKSLALHSSFHAFRERHLASGSDRSRAFRDFLGREAWWLEDYALFRALHDEHRACYWRDWEPELRDRHPAALEHARGRLADTILYYQYLAVARRRAVAARPRGLRRRRIVRRFPVHGERRTAPTSGRGSTSSISTRRSERRRTLSRRPVRTGGCRSIAGIVSRKGTTSGCGSGRGAAASSTTDFASII